MQLDPAVAGAHCNYGFALARSGRTEEATAQFQQTLRLRPDYPQTEFHLGTALAAQRHFGKTRDRLEAALRLDPNYPPARDLLDRIRNQ